MPLNRVLPRRLWTRTLVILLQISALFAYNIDLKFPLIFEGPQNSYFGYSVALHSNTQGNWLLAGAPKANSTRLLDWYQIKQSGALYQCSIHRKNCNEFILDDTGDVPVDDGHEYSYTSLKEGQWLGVSLDVRDSVNDAQIVTCAHRWINQKHQGFYLGNGMCFTIGGELQQSSVRELHPAVAFSQQSLKVSAFNPSDIYYLYNAQAGMSVHYSQKNGDLIMGAPGVYDWKGTLIEMIEKPDFGRAVRGKNARELYTTTIPRPPRAFNYDSYFGYAVSSGIFDKTRQVLYAIGGPRDDNHGVVFIVAISPGGHIVVKHRKEGSGQIGEYYGAAVCAMDVNEDGFDDLLVGAPFHSLEERSKGKGDQGRVFVYLSDGVGSLNQQWLVISGDSKPFARFGSAVASAGDINMDGFLDVAVGAPYENDGRGAVYVYTGSQNGLTTKYYQRIGAENISPLLTGFGISLARAKDVDKNNYPDLGIGAYSSDRAVVLRSSPIAKMAANIDFNVNRINMGDAKCTAVDGKPAVCFDIYACMKYFGKFLPPQQDVDIVLEMDTRRRNESSAHRGFFYDRGSNQGSTLLYTLTLENNKEVCRTQSVHMLESAKERDLLNPIQFRLSYSLSPNRRPNAGRDFCASCPVLDKSNHGYVTKELSFSNECGKDERCNSNLAVFGVFGSYGLDKAFVLGSFRTFPLNVSAINVGEPAYMATVLVNLPSWIPDISRPPFCDRNGGAVKCLIGNPLHANEIRNFTLTMVLDEIPPEQHELEIDLLVTTTSAEAPDKLTDNRFSIIVPFKIEIDIAVQGNYIQEQVLYQSAEDGSVAPDTKVVFNHKYDVFKLGPSPVKGISITILYPAASRDGTIKFMDIKHIDPVQSSSYPSFGQCEGNYGWMGKNTELNSGQDSTARPSITHDIIGEHGMSRKRRDADISQNVNKVQTGGPSMAGQTIAELNCSVVLCYVIRCSVGPVKGEVAASFTLTAQVDVAALRQVIGNVDTIAMFTMAAASVPDMPFDIQPPNHRPDNATVYTMVTNKTSIRESVPYWIIPVCILIGLLLLSAITYVIYRAGFFKRDQRDELVRLKRESLAWQDTIGMHYPETTATGKNTEFNRQLSSQTPDGAVANNVDEPSEDEERSLTPRGDSPSREPLNPGGNNTTSNRNSVSMSEGVLV